MVGLFLMTQKGWEVLQGIWPQYGKLIRYIVAEPDTNVEKDFYHEIHKFAMVQRVPFFSRKDHISIPVKHKIAIGWRWLIEESENLVIFHDSLLPRYRGFNPLVSALINGEKRIGVTALKATKEYDCGEIFFQIGKKIPTPIKIQKAIEIVSEIYLTLSLRLLKKISRGERISSKPQKESLATYSLWRDERDYRICWAESSEYIRRFVAATGFPYKGASSLLNGSLVRILDAEIETDEKIENRVPGKVIFLRNNLPVVVCGKGLLIIKALYSGQGKENLLPLTTFRSRFE